MKFSDLKTRFWDIFGGDEDIYPDVAAMLPTLANMAIRSLASETDCLVAKRTVTCTAGQQEYDMPSDCDKVLSAYYDGEKIRAVSKWDLQQSVMDGWDRFQGTPRFYYVGGLNEKIGLYRIPSVDTQTEETEGDTVGTGFGGLVGDDGYGRKIANTGYGAVLIDYGGTAYGVTGFGLDLFYAARPPEVENDEDGIVLPPWAAPIVLFEMLRGVYASPVPGGDVKKAAFWGWMSQAGRRRLTVRAASPTPKRYLMLEQDTEISRGTWPAMYPEHIEES